MQSPITRIRAGILRGPGIGDSDVVKQPSCIAIGINGSVSILQRCPRWKLQLLSQTEQLLISYAPEFFLGGPMSEYDIGRGNNPSNAMNLDMLNHIVSRLASGIMVPISHFPIHFRAQVRKATQMASEGDVSVDLGLLIRSIFNKEFGGVSL
jgi:hypothetical protein